MRGIEGSRGLTLVEVLVAAALLGASVVACASLSGMETRWSRDIEDRCHALALANNLLTLVQRKHRSCLEAGIPQDDGSFLTVDALATVPSAQLALGARPGGDVAEGALGRWVAERRAASPDGLTVTLWLRPEEPTRVGTCTCHVRWLGAAGRERWVSLAVVLAQ